MNPIEYIEKCNINDLINFRKETVFIDKNGTKRNSTRKGELIYIARVYCNASLEEIAKHLKQPISTIESQVSIIKNKGQLEFDRIDDLMREIAYWKYKQLNNK